MNKKIEDIDFSVANSRFGGQINMRRTGKSLLDSETTFYGFCQGKPGGHRLEASGKDIDAVRRSLYEQAEEICGLRNWEKWALIVVHVDNHRDWDINEKIGMDAPPKQEMKLRVEVVRYVRSEIEGREIWSNYYSKVPRPATDTLDGGSLGSVGDRYVGALLPDDERTRAFIARIQAGFNALESQMVDFLRQDNIENSVNRALNAQTMLLEAPGILHGEEES